MQLKKLINVLEKRYGEAEQIDPFRSLIFTILSQRTKDPTTYKATAELFKKYPNSKALAKAPVKSIEKLIKPVGFYKVKASRVKEVARIVEENGMPDTIEGLLALPGVGRKTANCVLVYGYGKDAIPVDVHVHRISNRLELVKTKTEEETEYALAKIVPKKQWIKLNHLIVRFGQDLCGARPKCPLCPLKEECPFYTKGGYTKT